MSNQAIEAALAALVLAIRQDIEKKEGLAAARAHTAEQDAWLAVINRAFRDADFTAGDLRSKLTPHEVATLAQGHASPHRLGRVLATLPGCRRRLLNGRTWWRFPYFIGARVGSPTSAEVTGGRTAGQSCSSEGGKATDSTT